MARAQRRRGAAVAATADGSLGVRSGERRRARRGARRRQRVLRRRRRQTIRAADRSARSCCEAERRCHRSRAARDAPARDGVAAARRRAAGDARGRRDALGEPRCAAGARAAGAGVSGRARRRARLPPSIARWWRSSATPASRSSPTGWCCSCEHRRRAIRSSPVKLTSGRPGADVPARPSSGRRPRRPAIRSSSRPTAARRSAPSCGAIPQLDERRPPAGRFVRSASCASRRETTSSRG